MDGEVAEERILGQDDEPELILVKLGKCKEMVLETTNLSETAAPLPGSTVMNWLNVFLAP